MWLYKAKGTGQVHCNLGVNVNFGSGVELTNSVHQ